MKILKILSISISLALLVSGSVFGATIKVPDDYATIQAAIDAAVDGDTVLVASGTYTGPIYFNGKIITVRSESGPNVTTIEGRVDFYDHETEESLLEGFTTWGSDIQASSPTIKNCRLKGEGTHSTGGHGSIYSGSSPTFIDCKIYGGQADVGGGYDVRGDSSATFIDSEFSNNQAGSNGGALYINNSTVSLKKCAFFQNSAGEEGGAISVTGSSKLNINLCNFSENSAQVGGGILNGYDDNTTISRSIFTKNTAEKWGGAIFANASTSFKTENCIFTENNANWHGGAIHINWSASPAITNSIFDTNIAGGGGGAIWIQPGSFSNITNCTFFKNNAGWRGGAILNSGSNPTISNSILWKDNAPEGPEIGEYKNSDPDPTVSHCDIQGGYPGIGNIDTDPLFIDPENGDFHLQYISPCIDSGTNDAPGLTLTDLDGKPRIINGNVDMGAYESELTKVNDYFSFEVDPSTYSFSSDTEGCQAVAVEKFSFDATLTNISEKELSNLHVEVDKLTNNNLLLTNNGLIGEGGRFEVPKIDDYADGYLSPEENAGVPFTVCLKNKKPFRFFVNVESVIFPYIGDPVPGIILNTQLAPGSGGSAGVIKTGGLVPGVEAFVDRMGQQWQIIPAQLIGADFIQTAQNNADVHPIGIDVTVAEGTILHMLVPEHDNLLPFEWMNKADFGADWKNTGALIVTSWTSEAQVWSTATPLPAGTYSFREIPTFLSFYGIAATQGVLP